MGEPRGSKPPVGATLAASIERHRTAIVVAILATIALIAAKAYVLVVLVAMTTLAWALPRRGLSVTLIVLLVCGVLWAGQCVDGSCSSAQYWGSLAIAATAALALLVVLVRGVIGRRAESDDR